MLTRKSVAALLVYTLLGGCGYTSYVKTSAKRFHTADFASGDRSFTVRAGDSSKQSSLEFQQYANEVAHELVTLGFRVASPSERAEYVVFIDYATSDGKTTNVPRYGTTGGGRTYTSGTVYGGHGGTASYSGYTYTPRIRGVIGMTSITSYTRVFTMDIFDMNKSTTDNFHKVFEGTANSVGSANDLSVVSGCLINTLFKGFPGKNGERIKDFTLLANCDR